jgi:hypothetical protein
MKTLFLLTEAGFILITVIYIALILLVLKRGLGASALASTKKRRIFIGILLSLGAWVTLIGILASKHFFDDFSTLPPKFFIVLIVPLITLLWATSRQSVKEILFQIPPQTILWLQSFRIFVEVLLWMLFVDNLLPVQMTFEGYNFDIISGLTAPVAALIFYKTRSSTFLLIWNICGLGLLINIVTIAILSTPVPFRVFMNEPANTIVTQFPIILLPGVLVPLAYTLHILSLRQVLAMRESKVVTTYRSKESW